MVSLAVLPQCRRKFVDVSLPENIVISLVLVEISYWDCFTALLVETWCFVLLIFSNIVVLVLFGGYFDGWS